MTIISQAIIEDAQQADGRRYMRYAYTDHLGKVIRTSLKKVASNFDANADMLTRIPFIEAHLAKEEIRKFLDQLKNGQNPLSTNPEYQTKNQAIRKILKFLGRLAPDSLIEYEKAFNKISSLTQTQVEALGFNWGRYQGWVLQIDSLRTSAMNTGTLEDEG